MARFRSGPIRRFISNPLLHAVGAVCAASRVHDYERVPSHENFDHMMVECDVIVQKRAAQLRAALVQLGPVCSTSTIFLEFSNLIIRAIEVLVNI